MRRTTSPISVASLFASLAFAGACSGISPVPETTAAQAPEEHTETRLEGRIWLVREARFATRAELEARLSATRFVLLGELHGHPEHHRLQAELITAMVANGRRPVVAMEQFDTDQAAALAAFQPAPPEAAAGLGEAVGWEDSGWPDWSRYQPIAEAAFRYELPLIAANLPRRAVRAVAMDGQDPRTLQDVQPAALDTPRPAAAKARLRDILMASHCHDLPQTVIDRMVLAQRVRDVVMAQRLHDAASGLDGGVLIAGNGHVDRGFGVPQDLRNLGEHDVFSLALLPTTPGQDLPDTDAGEYDAIWFTGPHPEQPPDPCEGR